MVRQDEDTLSSAIVTIAVIDGGGGETREVAVCDGRKQYQEEDAHTGQPTSREFIIRLVRALASNVVCSSDLRRYGRVPILRHTRGIDTGVVDCRAA